jgi:hypothetical protein
LLLLDSTSSSKLGLFLHGCELYWTDQTRLEDVQAVPVQAEDVPRWLTGIARRKVADEHRRRARCQPAELPDAGASTAPEVPDLLRRIQSELVEPEQRRTLGWLLREHAGDSLQEIAAELGIDPAALRQRVCGLRRTLRARYLWPLALLLAIGGGLAGLERRDAFMPAVSEASASLSHYDGVWRVVGVAPESYGSLEMRVVVRGGTARVEGATGALLGEVVLTPEANQRVTLRAGDRTWHAVISSRGADRVRLTSDRGYVEIERAPRAAAGR